MNVWVFMLLGFLAPTCYGNQVVSQTECAKKIQNDIEKQLNDCADVPIPPSTLPPNIPIKVKIADLAVVEVKVEVTAAKTYAVKGTLNVTTACEGFTKQELSISLKTELNLTLDGHLVRLISVAGTTSVDLKLLNDVKFSLVVGLLNPTVLVELLLKFVSLSITQICHVALSNALKEINYHLQEATNIVVAGQTLPCEVSEIKNAEGFFEVLLNIVYNGIKTPLSNGDMSLPHPESGSVTSLSSEALALLIKIGISPINVQVSIPPVVWQAYAKHLFPQETGSITITATVTEKTDCSVSENGVIVILDVQVKITSETGDPILTAAAVISTAADVKSLNGVGLLSLVLHAVTNIDISVKIITHDSDKCTCGDDSGPAIISLIISVVDKTIDAINCVLKHITLPQPLPLPLPPSGGGTESDCKPGYGQVTCSS